MARPGSSADSGAAAAASPPPVVFVDTSFDTHLAIAVSDSDTVSELKKKITQAHGSCFPELGKMKIDAVKVKRRGRSYHLFDSMLVTSAFRGVKKDWFISIDASSLVQQLPRPVITGEPSNAIVQIGGRHSLRGTADASGNGGEALKGVMVAVEGGGAVNASGEMMLPAVKYSRLRDEGSPSEDVPSKKRRKTKDKAPDVPNSADAILLPSGKNVLEQIDGRTTEVDNGDNVNESEKFVVIRSIQTACSDAHDRIALDGTEKADDALVEQAVKEKSQGAVDSVEENGSLPLVTVEHEKEMDAVAQPVDTEKFVDNMVSPKKMKSRKSKSSPREQLLISNPENHEGSPGNDSLVEPQKGIGYDQSEEKMNEKMNLPEAEGKELASMDANKESGKEQGVVKVLSPEITETAGIVGEKPKKGPKRRNSKEKNVDQTSDRPEEEQTDQSKVEKNETAATDGNENFNEEHKHEMGLSGEIAENAGNVEEKPKRRTKRRSSKEKSVDLTGDRRGTVQIHPSKPVESVAPDQNSHKEPVEEMGSLQHITDKVAAEDNVEKVKRKKMGKGSFKEKKDDPLSHRFDKEQSFVSPADERDTLTVGADGKELGNEMIQMLPITEKSADTCNLEEMKKEKTKRRGTKEKNVSRTDKEEANSSRAGDGEIMATMAAESKAYEQHANEMKEPCQVAEKSVHTDDGKGKRKKTRRQSVKEKNANQSSDVDKEEASFSQTEGGEAEPNVSKIYQLCEVAEELVHENIGQEEGKKRTTRQSSRENNADQPNDRIDKNQSVIAQENRLQSLLKIIQKSAEPDNDEKTQERTKDWGFKDIDQSSDITEKEENRSQGKDGKEPAVINADNSSKQDHAGNNEKAGKRSKRKQSSKKSAQSKGENKDEDTSNLSNSIRTAKPKMPESANAIDGTNDQDLNAQSMAKVASGPITDGNSSHAPVNSLEANYESIPRPEVANNLPLASPADEANNSVDELHGKENINFREYFVPPKSQLEVAPSGNSSVGEGPKGNRAGSDLKVKRGKRKAASSALTESLPLNEQRGKEKSRPSKSNKLTSPVQKLRKPTGSGSQASTFPKPKALEIHANPDDESGNSAASVSGMKRSNKPKRAGKSNSSTDHFRVAIRKPSSANKNMEEAVGGSGRKKSLLSLSGAIFREESSGSSKHEGVENSDASTRTPSDNLLSDYSDSDTNKNLTTLTDGSRRVEGHSKGKSSIKDVKSLSMDRILRSSSGYKKARIAAASQLNESESQPAEFVPDSQANE